MMNFELFYPFHTICIHKTLCFHRCIVLLMNLDIDHGIQSGIELDRHELPRILYINVHSIHCNWIYVQHKLKLLNSIRMRIYIQYVSPGFDFFQEISVVFSNSRVDLLLNLVQKMNVLDFSSYNCTLDRFENSLQQSRVVKPLEEKKQHKSINMFMGCYKK